MMIAAIERFYKQPISVPIGTESSSVENLSPPTVPSVAQTLESEVMPNATTQGRGQTLPTSDIVTPQVPPLAAEAFDPKDMEDPKDMKETDEGSYYPADPGSYCGYESGGFGDFSSGAGAGNCSYYSPCPPVNPPVNITPPPIQEVPEPKSFYLLLIGLGSLVYKRKGRNVYQKA